jgi:glycosyltransferase involved in cell wall biosynthesis
LKIAVLSRVFSPSGGGAERYSVELAKVLALRHEVHVFAQEFSPAIDGIHLHHMPLWFKKPRWLNQLWFAYFTWQATKQGFDIVHSHENVWHGNVQTMHVKTTKRDLLTSVKGGHICLRLIKIILSPRLMTYLAFERARMAFSPLRAVVATSASLRLELQEEYPKSASILHTVVPGVSQAGLQRDKATARQLLGLSVTGRKVLFVANDYVRKGLTALLQALVLLPTDVALLVVGNPKQTPLFEQQAQSLGIISRVTFLGSLSNMAAAYQSADILIHPTLEDSFAMVVLEAMANGVPVVVSDKPYCGFSSELCNGQDAVLLSNPRDSAALAQAALAVLETEPLRLNLVRYGLLLSQKYSWEKVAQAYEAIYQELA